MLKNVGKTDQYIRLVIAAVCLFLIFGGQVVGSMAWLVGIVGGIVAVTAFTGYCPLYKLLGMNTCPVNRKP